MSRERSSSARSSFPRLPLLGSGHKLLRAAERTQAGATNTQTVVTIQTDVFMAPRPVLSGISASATSRAVVRKAAELALAASTSIEVVHVSETEIVKELAIAPLTHEQATATLADLIDRLEASPRMAR